MENLSYEENVARQLVYTLLEEDINFYKILIPEIKSLDSEDFEKLFNGDTSYDYKSCKKNKLKRLALKFYEFQIIIEQWYRDKSKHKYIKDLWINIPNLNLLIGKEKEAIYNILNKNLNDFSSWDNEIKESLFNIINQTTIDEKIMEQKIQENKKLKDLLSDLTCIKKSLEEKDNTTRYKICKFFGKFFQDIKDLQNIIPKKEDVNGEKEEYSTENDKFFISLKSIKCKSFFIENCPTIAILLINNYCKMFLSNMKNSLEISKMILNNLDKDCENKKIKSTDGNSESVKKENFKNNGNSESVKKENIKNNGNNEISNDKMCEKNESFENYFELGLNVVNLFMIILRLKTTKEELQKFKLEKKEEKKLDYIIKKINEQNEIISEIRYDYNEPINDLTKLSNVINNLKNIKDELLSFIKELENQIFEKNYNKNLGILDTIVQSINFYFNVCNFKRNFFFKINSFIFGAGTAIGACDVYNQIKIIKLLENILEKANEEKISLIKTIDNLEKECKSIQTFNK